VPNQTLPESKEINLPPDIENVIEEIKLDRSVKSIWLIGSRANESISSSSDWDFLVFSQRESNHTYSNYSGVDIFWVGPSGRVLLEGQPDFLAFPFSDLNWTQDGETFARYSGRRFTKLEVGVAHDASIPTQVRKEQWAVLVWCNQHAPGVDHGSA